MRHLAGGTVLAATAALAAPAARAHASAARAMLRAAAGHVQAAAVHAPDRLEKAGLVTGQLELSADGKAMKYFEPVPFEVRITAETVVRALVGDDGKDALRMEESDQ